MGSVLSRYVVEFKDYYLEDALQVLWHDVKDLLFGEQPILTDELLEVLYEDDGTNYETEKVWGVVTKLIENKSVAVINNHIYMNLSLSVPGGKTLRLDDQILCTIKRRSVDDAWLVDKIELVERKKTLNGLSSDEFGLWDLESSNLLCDVYDNANVEDFKGLKPQTLVAQVTATSEELTLDNGKLKIPTSACKGVTYAVGDWVNIRVLIDPEEPTEKPKILNLAPLRQWKSEGRITVLEGSTGVVDNDIYFNESVCTNG